MYITSTMTPSTQVSKQLPLKKYRGPKHVRRFNDEITQVHTSSSHFKRSKKNSKPPLSIALSRGALLKELGNNEDPQLPESRSTSKDTNEICCAKFGFPPSILGSASSRPADLLVAEVKPAIEYKSVNMDEDAFSEDSSVATDYTNAHHQKLCVPPSAANLRVANESSSNTQFTGLELLRDVSLERMKASVEKSVLEGMAQVWPNGLDQGDRSGFRFGATSLSHNGVPTAALMNRNFLHGPQQILLNNWSSPRGDFNSLRQKEPGPRRIVKGAESAMDYQSMPPFAQLSFGNLNASSRGITALPFANRSASSLDDPMLALLAARANATTEFLLRQKAVGSFSGPLDDESITSTNPHLTFQSSWQEMARSGFNTPIHITKKETMEVPGAEIEAGTMKGPSAEIKAQADDTNAFDTILGLAQKMSNKARPIAKAEPGHEGPSSKSEPEDVQHFEKTEKDVIFGRGTGPNLHNVFFREEVARERPAYLAGHNAEQEAVVLKLFNFVKKKGGRFLKQAGKGKPWYEVKDKEVFSKVRQMIREYKTKEQREQSSKAKKKDVPTKKKGQPRCSPALSQVLAS